MFEPLLPCPGGHLYHRGMYDFRRCPCACEGFASQVKSLVIACRQCGREYLVTECDTHRVPAADVADAIDEFGVLMVAAGTQAAVA